MERVYFQSITASFNLPSYVVILYNNNKQNSADNGNIDTIWTNFINKYIECYGSLSPTMEPTLEPTLEPIDNGVLEPTLEPTDSGDVNPNNDGENDFNWSHALIIVGVAVAVTIVIVAIICIGKKYYKERKRGRTESVCELQGYKIMDEENDEM